jgi:hypothetical protein
MAEDDDQTGDLFICALSDQSPAAVEQRLVERREVELSTYRARRARRIAELGLGSHRKDP